ncbi:hypothetical protein G9438_02735 [Enterococcus hirae]|uniref:hypothetical protein n=1 Tax=Enterococcus hirae TaxID=1354 RepID=UPI00187DFAEB|nr:hypothetical protein [Enterococcus hirae]MBE8866683.1 hypothetical protein [Enterococcus hirae]
MPNDKQKIAVIRTGSQYAIALQLIKDHKLVRGEANSSEKLATLGKILSNYKRDSAEGIISYLPLLPEEKKLLRQRNIQMNSDDRIVVDDKNKTFYINYLNQKYDLSKKAVLSKETKHALIQDLDKFYFDSLDLNRFTSFIYDLDVIARRDVQTLLKKQTPKIEKSIKKAREDIAVDQVKEIFKMNRHYTEIPPTLMVQFQDELKKSEYISKKRQKIEIEKLKNEYKSPSKPNERQEYFKMSVKEFLEKGSSEQRSLNKRKREQGKSEQGRLTKKRIEQLKTSVLPKSQAYLNKKDQFQR